MRLRQIKITSLFSTLLLIIGCSQAAESDTLTIAENGIAKAVIVISPNVSEPEQHAASELAKFLEQITGAEFEIVPPPAADRPRLLIGQKAAALTRASRPRSLNWLIGGLGTDGIIISKKGNDLILAGGHPRGTWRCGGR